MRISDWSSDVCSSDLEGLDVAFSEMLGLGVEQPSVRTAHTIRPERLFEFVRLKQDGKPGQRALRSRRGSERTQRRPQVLFYFRCDLNAFPPQHVNENTRRHVPLDRRVHSDQRIKRQTT